MGKAKRKMRPQPPWWWELDNDNCWFCKNRNNCNGFTTEENQKMIQMFLSDIGYEFDETEINRIVKETHDQREIMSKTIQLLAEKI